jgi:hypothetical protein
MFFDSSTLNIIIVALLVIGFWVYFLRSNVRVTNKMIMRVAQQQSVIRHNDAVHSLCRAIHLLRPDAHAGTDYIVSEGGPDQSPYIAEWLNPRIARPSDEEIEQVLQNIDDIDPAKDHAALRRKEYPSVGDQLGAAYNARHGDDTDQIMLDEQIRKVKEKYPKSESDERL